MPLLFNTDQDTEAESSLAVWEKLCCRVAEHLARLWVLVLPLDVD